MEKILITGSSGFIGRHLVVALREVGHTVIEADRCIGIDLCDPVTVKSLPEVDRVVHLAAFNGTKHFYQRPLDVIRDSVLPTQYLLDRYAGSVKRFVFSGSCESYAGTVNLYGYKVPTDEQVPLTISDITNPRWSYGGSKIVNELQCTAAWHQCQQEYSIIRYHNIYGPGQVDHFIPEFYNRARQGDLSLNGWKNTRSFMYISDAIRATLHVIFESAFSNQIVNVGVENEISILELAKMILNISNITGDLILNPAPEGSIDRRCGDISRLQGLTNFTPSVSLEDGVKLTLESLL